MSQAELLARDEDPGRSISHRTPVRLPLATFGVAVLAVAGAAASWAVSQQQLAAHERRLETLSARQAEADARVHDMRVLLERIDERTATMKQQLERMNARTFRAE